MIQAIKRISLALLVLGFGLTCYYRGWCAVEPLPSDLGKSAFRVEIDRIKIAQDVMEGAKAAQRALNTNEQTEKAKNEAGAKTTQANDKTQ